MLINYLKRKSVLWEGVKYYLDKYMETDDIYYGNIHKEYVKEFLKLTNKPLKEKLFYKRES